MKVTFDPSVNAGYFYLVQESGQEMGGGTIPTLVHSDDGVIMVNFDTDRSGRVLGVELIPMRGVLPGDFVNALLHAWKREGVEFSELPISFAADKTRDILNLSLTAGHDPANAQWEEPSYPTESDFLDPEMKGLPLRVRFDWSDSGRLNGFEFSPASRALPVSLLQRVEIEPAEDTWQWPRKANR